MLLVCRYVRIMVIVFYCIVFVSNKHYLSLPPLGGVGGGGGQESTRENIGAPKTERDKLKWQQAIAL
jgi:hypothetical protein